LLLLYLFLSGNAFAAASVSAVSVDISNPIIGNAFNVTFNITGANSGDNYYVKCRIGPNGSSLTDGQTFNSPTWLNDIDAWVSMPQFQIGADGTMQSSFQCRVRSGSVDESKVIYVSACLNSSSSCGTSFQSANSLNINPVAPTATPTPTAVPSPTSAPTATPTPTSMPTATPTPSPTPTPTIKLTPTPTINQLTPSALTNPVNQRAQNQQVLGQQQQQAQGNSLFQIPSATDSGDKIVTFSNTDNNIISKVFVIIGIIFIALCAILIIYPKVQEKIKQTQNEQ
jgi:preprotein translocase subunit SecG